VTAQDRQRRRPIGTTTDTPSATQREFCNRVISIARPFAQPYPPWTTRQRG
jgi:hypothetical protein